MIGTTLNFDDVRSSPPHLILVVADSQKLRAAMNSGRAFATVPTYLTRQWIRKTLSALLTLLGYPWLNEGILMAGSETPCSNQIWLVEKSFIGG